MELEEPHQRIGRRKNKNPKQVDQNLLCCSHTAPGAVRSNQCILGGQREYAPSVWGDHGSGRQGDHSGRPLDVGPGQVGRVDGGHRGGLTRTRILSLHFTRKAILRPSFWRTIFVAIEVLIQAFRGRRIGTSGKYWSKPVVIISGGMVATVCRKPPALSLDPLGEVGRIWQRDVAHGIGYSARKIILHS